MARHFTALLLLLASYTVSSQTRFESGYFIDANGNRVDCLIKNHDWKNTPDKFQYRFADNQTVLEHKADEVKEFGIGEELKYVLADIELDRSSRNLQNLSREKNPLFSNERRFVKVLVHGKASLYVYEEQGLTRFFYSVGEKSVKPLVYKKYLSVASRGDSQVFPVEVRENNQFRVQLWTDLRCSTTEMKKVERVSYEEKQLVKYFREIQNCIN